MPRLRGYQKKRDYVEKHNKNFSGRERRQEEVVAEYHRLKNIEDARVAEQIALQEKAEQVKQAAAEKLANASLNSTLQPTNNNVDIGLRGGDSTEGSHFTERPCEGVLGATSEAYVNVTADDDWGNDVPSNTMRDVAAGSNEAFESSAYATEHDWANAAANAQEDAGLGGTTTWAQADAWGAEEPVAADANLPDDGQGKWSTVPKRQRQAAYSGANGNRSQGAGGCFNCGGNHKKADCTEPPKPRGECHKCHEEGHFAAECPNGAGGGSGGGRTCFNCGSTDHMKRDCPNANAGGSSDRECYKCQQVGHISRDCPNGGGGGGPGRTCYNCGEAGHMSRDCPAPRQEGARRPGGRGACYKCGQEGHQARSCPETGADFAGDNHSFEEYGGGTGFNEDTGFGSSGQVGEFGNDGLAGASEWQSGAKFDQTHETDGGDGGDGMW